MPVAGWSRSKRGCDPHPRPEAPVARAPHEANRTPSRCLARGRRPAEPPTAIHRPQRSNRMENLVHRPEIRTGNRSPRRPVRPCRDNRCAIVPGPASSSTLPRPWTRYRGCSTRTGKSGESQPREPLPAGQPPPSSDLIVESSSSPSTFKLFLPQEGSMVLLPSFQNLLKVHRPFESYSGATWRRRWKRHLGKPKAKRSERPFGRCSPRSLPPTTSPTPL